jgi:hypothetical protein
MDWLRDQVKRGMNPRTYVLVGLLVATLVWIQSLDERQRALRAKARASSPPPAAAVAAVAVASAGRQGPTTPAAAGWGRDPFEQRFGLPGSGVPASARPPKRARNAPVATGLYLQGVMKGPAGRTALINGEVYREGERVGSGEVLQIGTRSVLLLEGGTVKTLTLKGDGS